MLLIIEPWTNGKRKKDLPYLYTHLYKRYKMIHIGWYIQDDTYRLISTRCITKKTYKMYHLFLYRLYLFILTKISIKNCCWRYASVYPKSHPLMKNLEIVYMYLCILMIQLCICVYAYVSNQNLNLFFFKDISLLWLSRLQVHRYSICILFHFYFW